VGRNTVSITTQVWGEQYGQFIPRWWESVRTLNRKPDEIVLVGTHEDLPGLMSSVPDWVDVPVVKIQTHCDFMQEWGTVGFNACSMDWLVAMPIDDQFAPTALDSIADADGDLIIDRTTFLQGGEWPANWNPEQRHSRHFAPAGLAPFHRRLLPLWNEIPNDFHWNDYLFYLLAFKAGVKVHRTNNHRMIHDLGHTHATISGPMLDSPTRAAADSQLAEIRQRLGL
jgi:hypothetical protein